MRHEIFIAHTPYEYQEMIKSLQEGAWIIAMVQYIAGPQPSWVITGQLEREKDAETA